MIRRCPAGYGFTAPGLGGYHVYDVDMISIEDPKLARDR